MIVIGVDVGGTSIKALPLEVAGDASSGTGGDARDGLRRDAWYGTGGDASSGTAGDAGAGGEAAGELAGSVRGGAANEDGVGVRVLGEELRRPTPDGAEAVLETIAEMVDALRATRFPGTALAGAARAGSTGGGVDAGSAGTGASSVGGGTTTAGAGAMGAGSADAGAGAMGAGSAGAGAMGADQAGADAGPAAVDAGPAAVDAAAIGVVVPGIVDEPAGIAVHAANVGWEHTRVRDRLTARTGLPVALGHDVRAGGLAEWRLGAGRGSRNVLVVMLGTGIGSAVISDGRLLSGDGYAGQLGHVVVDPDGPFCGCGQRGCLGVLASASAVDRRYRERVQAAGTGGRGEGRGRAPGLTAPGGGEAGVSGPVGARGMGVAGAAGGTVVAAEAGGGAVVAAEVAGAREVAERARAGDPAAVSVWTETVDHLATALTTAVTLFGPEVIVLGGGLALAGEQLVHPVAERLAARLTFQRVPRVVRAELGDRSGIIGAALLAAQLDHGV